MTVQEIFNLPSIQEVESEIISIESGFTLTHEVDDKKVAIIKELLRVRKSLLDKVFTMNAEYATLLAEFNESLRQTLVNLSKQMIKAYDAVKSAGIEGDISSWGECWLGFQYPEQHPVQTVRARKMWEILNGSRDHYVDFYDEGVDGWNNKYEGGRVYDDNMEFDGLEKDCFNCNHHLEGPFTDNLHLILPTHFLYDDKSFSIFDILWQRNFTTEVRIEVDHHSSDVIDDEDLNWDELDYS